MLLVASLLTGCFGDTKEFSCQDLTMSVPFTMKDVSGQGEFYKFDFALDSAKIAIFGLREHFSILPDASSMTVREYAEMVIRANNHQAMAIARSNEEYFYFTYEASTDEGTFEYLAGCYKGEDAFWLIQIAAKKADFDKETFLGYLDSVEIN